MRWLVYETRNLVNGKVYIGVHKQEGEEFDGYLGSGTQIVAAVAKYGAESFERKTLFSFDNETSAYEKEKELVDRLWVTSTATYNIKTGGIGGDGHSHTEESKELIRRFRTGRKHPPEVRAKIAEASRGQWKSEEHRRKIGEKISIANRKRVVTEESKEKIRQSMLRYWEERRRGT